MPASLRLFSKNLGILMRKRNVNRQKLADRIEQNIVSVDHWLSGKNFPKYETIILLCEALDYYDIYSFLTKEIEITELDNKNDVVVLEKYGSGLIREVSKDFLEYSHNQCWHQHNTIDRWINPNEGDRMISSDGLFDEFIKNRSK